MSSSNASVKAEGVLALLGAYKPDEDDAITVLHPSKTFENAGLEPPAAGWTVEQFLDAAQKLTSGDEADRRYGFASMLSSAQDLLFFLRMYGVSATRGSGDALAPNFDDPQLAQAVRAYLGEHGVELITVRAFAERLNADSGTAESL